MAILDITTYAGPYPSVWGLLDDDAQTVNDADTSTLPQARITALKMYETAGAGASGTTDDDAIHDNVAAEIFAITEKATPISADLLVIEDSAAANVKKKVQVGNLPGGGMEIDAFDFGSSSASSVDIDVTGWDTVEIRWDGIGFNVADGLWARVSTDGVSFDSGASDYRQNQMNDGANSSAAGSEMQLNANAIGTANRHGAATISNLSAASYKTKYSSLSGSHAATESVIRYGFRDAAQVDTHIRVFAALGNTINAGKLRVFGIA